ncbi:STAS domain-containing protein [Nitrospinaceae bacterium]|nr:STAS domain-containing protein [Nitrospinaceae bacterium]
MYNSPDLSHLIDAYIERGFKKFILNLEKVTYLDSSTISTFIQFFQALKEEGRFVLTGLHGAPKEVFELAKFRNVFEIFPDVAAAMKVNS